jgi:SOS response regulatory protein OraA/RecX
MSPLDEIWEWYEVTRDSLRLALRLIKSISISAPLSSDVILKLIPQSFQSDPLDEVTRKLQQAEHKLLDDLAVVALWASFEQQVLDHLEQAVQRALKQKRRDRLQQRDFTRTPCKAKILAFRRGFGSL